MDITFTLCHTTNSTGEAYNVTAIFYFPNYITPNGNFQTNYSGTYTTNETSALFSVIFSDD
jgi:hypothetical protein